MCYKPRHDMTRHDTRERQTTSVAHRVPWSSTFHGPAATKPTPQLPHSLSLPLTQTLLQPPTEVSVWTPRRREDAVAPAASTETAVAATAATAIVATAAAATAAIAIVARAIVATAARAAAIVEGILRRGGERSYFEGVFRGWIRGWVGGGVDVQLRG